MNKINITITGATNTGKTTIQELIADALAAKGFVVELDYGTDGNPNRTDECKARCEQSVLKNIEKIVIETISVAPSGITAPKTQTN